MHTRPGKRLVVARHGHGDEAHGDRAGLGCEDGLAVFLVCVFRWVAVGKLGGGIAGAASGDCTVDGGYANALSTRGRGERTFFCHGEGCGGELRRGW